MTLQMTVNKMTQQNDCKQNDWTKWQAEVFLNIKFFQRVRMNYQKMFTILF